MSQGSKEGVPFCFFYNEPGTQPSVADAQTEPMALLPDQQWRWSPLPQNGTVSYLALSPFKVQAFCNMD